MAVMLVEIVTESEGTKLQATQQCIHKVYSSYTDYSDQTCVLSFLIL